MTSPRTVQVVPYDPRWPRMFEDLVGSIWPAVAGLALAIEHVGSTAVPGLSAKPILDVDVVVPDGQQGAGIQRLATLDYRHVGDLGIPGREAFVSPQAEPRHNLYVCPASSAALANHLAIRDHLRGSPEDARAYATLKLRLAQEYPNDSARYTRSKTDFLLSILRRCGFSSESLTEIAGANRL